MENQEARKQIEAALGQFFLRYRHAFLSKVWDRIITHLVEEVIVVGCEVVQENGSAPWTFIRIPSGTDWEAEIAIEGHHGREGPAWAIIISQEEDET